ncbi:MAG TPA: hypothetical protein VGH40_01240 [Roseiarcus sp.]|jgi:hypothetical protein
MATGRLHVAYRTSSGVGMIYCLNVHDDAVLWNRAIDPDVERLAIHPGGQREGRRAASHPASKARGGREPP